MFSLAGPMPFRHIHLMKSIAYTVSARRQLRKLDAQVRAQVEVKLARYAETGAGDVSAMQGVPGARLRVGDFRVVFVETEAQIDVLAVGHRREVYR